MTWAEFLLARLAEDGAITAADRESKRQVVNAAGYHLEFGRVTPESEELALSTLRALATVYADHPDHPDHGEAWRP